MSKDKISNQDSVNNYMLGYELIDQHLYATL